MPMNQAPQPGQDPQAAQGQPDLMQQVQALPPEAKQAIAQAVQPMAQTIQQFIQVADQATQGRGQELFTMRVTQSMGGGDQSQADFDDPSKPSEMPTAVQKHYGTKGMNAFKEGAYKAQQTASLGGAPAPNSGPQGPISQGVGLAGRPAVAPTTSGRERFNTGQMVT